MGELLGMAGAGRMEAGALRTRSRPKRGNGQGSVYRDGPYWVAAVTIPGSGGRRLKRRARTEREARRLLGELLRQASRGALSPPSRVTLGEWARAWCAEKALALRASAHRTLEQSLSPLWRPAEAVPPTWAAWARLGAVRVDRLQGAAVAEAVTALLRAGAGPRRVQLAFGHLRACLDAAVRRGLAARNVLQDVPRPRAPERERPEWTHDHLRRFLQVAADPATARRYEAAPFLAFLALTGLRTSEGLGLTWADVTLPSDPSGASGASDHAGLGWVWVRRALVWSSAGTYRVERPKTRAGERAVALVPLAVTLLRRRWAALPEERRRPEARVWARARARARTRAWAPEQDAEAGDAEVGEAGEAGDGAGVPYSLKMLSKTMKRLCALAEVPAANVHHLRHAHTALLVAEGLDLQTVRRHLGHARAELSLSRYAYPMTDGTAVAEAVRRALADGAE